jgi:hypothetical protein
MISVPKFYPEKLGFPVFAKQHLADRDAQAVS